MLYAPLEIRRPKLKIGVMLDGLSVPAWAAGVLSEIANSDIAELTVAIVNDTPVVPAASRLKRLLSGNAQINNMLYYRYVGLDNARHPQFSAPFASQDVANLFPARLAVLPISKKFVDRFSEQDVAAIEKFDLDVILRFGFKIIRGDILSAARFGVWSYHHDDNNEYRGGPAQFWEIFERNPVSGVVLQVLTDKLDGGNVIYRSYGATISNLWLSQNKMQAYDKAASFVQRCLRQLYQTGAVLAEAETGAYQKPIYRTPTNLQMLAFGLKSVSAGFKNRIRSQLQYGVWFIAYRRSAASESALPSTGGFVHLKPPRGRFFADPHVISREGEDYIFFEDYSFDAGKGVISFVKIDGRGRASAPQLALEQPQHLSYPFLFEWNGDVYMIPETCQANNVQLLRAKRFPDQWEAVATLLEGYPAVDATLFEHDRRWFMFANISERGGSTRDELFLFVGDTPLGPWRPHPLNPIKSDARSTRPAGNLFRRGNKIIRPSQDCTNGYGSSIMFSEVEVLSDTDYRERVIGRLDPTWAKGIVGTHTYSSNAALEAVDALQYQFRFR